MALPIGGAISLLGGLLGGGSDPNAGRYRQADDFYQQALNGSIEAEVHLRILSGIKDPRGVTYGFITAAQLASTSFSSSGWATQAARDYGKQKLAQLEAARKLSSAGATLVNALGGTATPAPKPGAGSIAGQSLATGTYAGVPTWAWAAGGGLVVYMLAQQGMRQGAGKR